MNNKIKIKLQRALKGAAQIQPFSTPILAKLQFIESREVESFAFKGEDVLFNPETLEQMPVELVSGILVHIVGYNAAQHNHSRRPAPVPRATMFHKFVNSDLGEKLHRTLHRIAWEVGMHPAALIINSRREKLLPLSESLNWADDDKWEVLRRDALHQFGLNWHELGRRLSIRVRRAFECDCEECCHEAAVNDY